MNILHISDFHISPAKSNSLLRLDGLKTYVNYLVDAIGVSIDYIIITGDFIDVSNKRLDYSLAYEVVDYVSKKLNVQKNGVFLCPGNHDFRWTERRKLINQPSRREYEIFHKKITGDDPNDGIIMGHKTISDGNIMFVMLNSIYAANDHRGVANYTSTQKTKFIDEFSELLVQAEVSNIAILSHYPSYKPTKSNTAAYNSSEINKSFEIIKPAIERAISEAPDVTKNIMIFSGDFHHSFTHQAKYSKRAYVTISGAGNFDWSKNDLNPSVHVLEVGDALKIHPYKWQLEHAKDDLARNKWVQLPTVNYPLPLSRKIESVIYPKKIDSDLYDFLTREINEYKSYSIGRFKIQDTNLTALLWLQIDDLLGGGKSVNEIFVTRVASLVKKLNAQSKSLMIGAGVYGSLLGGMLSPVVNLPLVLFDSSKGKFESTLMKDFTKQYLDTGGEYDHIVIIVDVIRTGQVLQRLIKGLNAWNVEYNEISVIALVSSPFIEKFPGHEKITIYSCVNDFKFIIVEDEVLPDKDVWPLTRQI